MYKMFALMDDGYFPDPQEEGATGDLDNKGGIFIPGGMLYEDTDGRPVGRKEGLFSDYTNFSEVVQLGMKHDNATLLFDDFAQVGINIPNEFFTKTAIKIINMKNVLSKSPKITYADYVTRVDSNVIANAYSPRFITPPYGARMKISSCLAVCYSEPQAYFFEAANYYSLRDKTEEQFWQSLHKSLNPIEKDGDTLISPAIIVCHTSRYIPSSITGLVRILPTGSLGTIYTITVEFIDQKIRREIEAFGHEFTDDFVVEQYKSKQVGVLIRKYSTRGMIKPTKKPVLKNIYPIYLKDLDVNMDEIKHAAIKRYGKSGE